MINVGSFLLSGKTTILYRFKMEETVNTLPTIGFNVETLSPMKGLTLTVWDMGGQERMRPLWKMYLRGTDGKSLHKKHDGDILYNSMKSTYAM